MGGGEGKDGEALGKMGFEPGGEFGGGGGVGGDAFVERALALGRSAQWKTLRMSAATWARISRRGT